MKTSKFLFFLTITLFGVIFAVFTVMADSTSTPSFEVENTSPTGGPSINMDLTLSTTQVDQREEITLQIGVTDVSSVKSVIMKMVNSNDLTVGQTTFNDDGVKGDVKANDGIYSKTWNIGTQVDGSYNIDIIMTDSLGNVNITRYASVLSIIGGDGITCENTLNCVGDEICCDQTCVYNECVSNSECVRCTDLDLNTGKCNKTESGNCNTSLCPNVCEYSKDAFLPSIDIISPLDSVTDPNQPFTTNTIIMKVQAEDTDSSIDWVEFEIDGSSPSFIQNFDQSLYGYPNEYWQTITLTDGTHTVMATAYDVSGNKNESSIEVEFALTSNGPIIDSMTTDKKDYISDEVIQVSLTAHDDDSDITLVDFYSSLGGGPIAQHDIPTRTLDINMDINASLIAEWGYAFDKYAVRQDSFKLPFIEIAEAATDSNCTGIEQQRYIYAMVSDDTNPATLTDKLNLVIMVTGANCLNTDI